VEIALKFRFAAELTICVENCGAVSKAQHVEEAGGIAMIMWENSFEPLGHENLLYVDDPPKISIPTVGVRPDTEYPVATEVFHVLIT
jgi:hypothetical protein